MSSPRPDPVAAVVLLLTVFALSLYVWLEAQKGDGSLELTTWFVSGLLIAVVVTGYACATASPRRRVALAGAGLLLLLLAPLSTVSLSTETSRPRALFAAYGIPLVTAGVLALVRSRLHRPWPRAGAVAAAATAVVVMVASVVAAAQEATRGEGISGLRHGDATSEAAHPGGDHTSSRP